PPDTDRPPSASIPRAAVSPSHPKPKRPPEQGRLLSLTELRKSLGYTPRVLKMVWTASPVATVVMGLLTVVAALLPLMVAYAGKRIIDAVVAHSRADTLRWVLVELGIIAAQALIQRGLELTKQLLGARLSIDIHLRILDKALALELRHF